MPQQVIPQGGMVQQPFNPNVPYNPYGQGQFIQGHYNEKGEWEEAEYDDGDE